MTQWIYFYYNLFKMGPIEINSTLIDEVVGDIVKKSISVYCSTKAVENMVICSYEKNREQDTAGKLRPR